MKYEVVLEGVFAKEIIVEASSVEEAEGRARELFDSEVGLTKEDYTIDSTSTIPEEI